MLRVDKGQMQLECRWCKSSNVMGGVLNMFSVSSYLKYTIACTTWQPVSIRLEELDNVIGEPG
jgi:hypothetical protein